MNKKERCKKHPENDPREKLGNSQCLDCCNLHNGTKPIGDFGGEFKANDRDVDNAKVKIGPMTLGQFGSIRYSLGWDYYFSDGPSWYADEKNGMIYTSDQVNDRILKEAKEMGCEVVFRKWSAPKLFSVSADEEEEGVIILLKAGSNKREISLTLKPGVSILETAQALSNCASELHKVPNEDIMESVEKSK
ncbi:hypothetical protein ACFL2R_02030 [Patescibacteria group bacterium]